MRYTNEPIEVELIAAKFSESYRDENVPQSQIFGGTKGKEFFEWHEDDEKLRDAIEKLSELEDVEEKLEIDLIAFSKVLYALDNVCVYVKVKKTKQYDGYSIDEETGEIERRIITSFYRYINGARDWFFTTSFSCISPSTDRYSIKDYGKTWALTREELE